MTELGIDLGRFLGTSLRSWIALAAENLSLVTSHPTAAWTLQQFREVLAMPHPYRFVLHDRDNIYYSPWFDAAVTAMGVRVLRTPVQAPKANAYCKRLLGSLRRECLDYLIPFGEAHLCRILRAWQLHYNRGGLTAVSAQAFQSHRLGCRRS
jgi:transposase InsO family protein